MAVMGLIPMETWMTRVYTTMFQLHAWVRFFHDAFAVTRGHSTLTACYPPNEDLARAVDLEVIKTRTDVPSESDRTLESFRTKLLQRDVRCVRTGIPAEFGVGLHVIPYERGSEVRSTIAWEDV